MRSAPPGALIGCWRPGFARVLFHPLTTSLAMLATPWLLYLTPWYTAALQSEWVGAPTRILLVAIGFRLLLCPPASGSRAPQILPS